MGNEVKLSKKFRCEDVYSEINGILRNIIEIHEESKTEKGYSFDYDIYKDYEGLFEILINVLNEKSNLKSVLKDRKNSLDIRTTGKAFKKIEDHKNEDDLYKRFLNELNPLLNDEIMNFYFLIPLNIQFSTSDYEEDLKKILKVFNLDIVNLKAIEKILDHKIEEKLSESEDDIFKDIDPTKEEILKELSKYKVILYTELNARSLYYADNEARFRVKSFLGFLVFLNTYLSETEYYGHIEDFSLNRMNYELFIVIGNKRLIWPTKLTLETLERKSIEEFKERKFDFLKMVYKDIEKIKSDSLRAILRNEFYNYFEASTAKALDYSFLKFWIITENIIKSGSSKTDDELIEIIKSLLSEELLQKRVDPLYKTRNYLVHAGKSASSSDRNLAKKIADLVLTDALNKMPLLSNKKQFDYYLSNKKSKRKNRKDLSIVLDLFNKKEI